MDTFQKYLDMNINTFKFHKYWLGYKRNGVWILFGMGTFFLPSFGKITFIEIFFVQAYLRQKYYASQGRPD